MKSRLSKYASVVVLSLLALASLAMTNPDLSMRVNSANERGQTISQAGGMQLRPLPEPEESETERVVNVALPVLNPRLAARTGSQVQLHRLPDVSSAMAGALDSGSAVYIWGFTRDGRLAGLTDPSNGMLLGWVATDQLIFDEYEAVIAREIDLYSRPNSQSKSLGKLMAAQSVVVLGADARGEWLAINTLLSTHNIVGWIPADYVEQATEARPMTKR